MLKKIVTAVFASALTFALAAPAALACPAHEDETAKEETEQPGVIAQEDESKPAEEAPKVEKKQQPKAKAEKVAKKQKRPVRVAKK